MAKKQTGLRMDRVLYVQFQQLCVVENLRPGEAAERLFRLAVDAGSICEVIVRAAGPRLGAQMIDEVLFRSRLARLQASLESEKRYWIETGELVEEPESEGIVKELVELGRRSIGPELIQELEKILINADQFYREKEKTRVEQWIKQRRNTLAMIPGALLPDKSQEALGT